MPTPPKMPKGLHSPNLTPSAGADIEPLTAMGLLEATNFASVHQPEVIFDT